MIKKVVVNAQFIKYSQLADVYSFMTRNILGHIELEIVLQLQTNENYTLSENSKELKKIQVFSLLQVLCKCFILHFNSRINQFDIPG